MIKNLNIKLKLHCDECSECINLTTNKLYLQQNSEFGNLISLFAGDWELGLIVSTINQTIKNARVLCPKCLKISNKR